MMVHNLNLVASYVPDWGPWEVVRELVCNAIDADPEGWQCIEQGHPDQLVVRTNTVPDMASLFVIGQGTKRPGGDTIGQFGEGVKMAALAAARINPSGGLVLNTPGHTITFEFRQHLGVDTLHAIVTDSDNPEVFQATINLPGAAIAYRGKIVQDMPVGPMRRKDAGGMRVFVKGVYIATIKGHALWDWNLDSLDMNRDRAMVSEWQARWAMGEWLQDNMTPEQARAILFNPDSIEGHALEYHHNTDHCKAVMLEAFRLTHGDKAVLAEGSESDQVAARKGFHVTYIENRIVRNALQAAGVETTRTATKAQYDMVPVDTAPYAAKIAWLRQLDDIVKAPAVTVKVFAIRNDDLRGWADFENDRVLWLSEGLFSEGNDLELVRTYCHELAHFLTTAYDGSVGFEAGLDGVAGRLAMHILGGMR